MRSLQSWLDEYGESHRHPVNKRIHWVCVPLIMLSVLGLLWELPRPAPLVAFGPFVNWATLLVALACAYYFLLSRPLALGMLAVSVVLCTMLLALQQLPWPLWQTSLAIFAGAWLGQFIGHAIEGRKPSFFKDIQFLLIGPAWLLAHLYRRWGIVY
ncbi:MAG TPA: Mpo1-like protein [Gammaproteobacteria bacterium]|nr:Mpo1-like protein [Gammaproteobacteria bacterium]